MKGDIRSSDHGSSRVYTLPRGSPGPMAGPYIWGKARSETDEVEVGFRVQGLGFRVKGVFLH